jgi:excisionase family DNA binding protein
VRSLPLNGSAAGPCCAGSGTETKQSQPGEAETPTTDQRKPLPTTNERKMIMERMLFTVRETADLLGISRSRVYELIWANRLASMKIGRSRRVSLASIRRFVDEEAA